MEFDIENKIIDIIISNLEYGQFKHLPTGKVIEEFGISGTMELDKVFKICEELDLIDRKGKRTYAFLTLNGYNIQREGGWLKYIERKENEQIKSEERLNKTDQILELELKLKTFEAKNGRRMIIAGFIITVLSFLVSILTVQFYQPDENKDQQKDLKEKPILPKKVLNKKDNQGS